VPVPLVDKMNPGEPLEICRLDIGPNHTLLVPAKFAMPPVTLIPPGAGINAGKSTHNVCDDAVIEASELPFASRPILNVFV